MPLILGLNFLYIYTGVGIATLLVEFGLGAALKYVQDTVCFVYTCRRLIDLCLIAGTVGSCRCHGIR